MTARRSTCVWGQSPVLPPEVILPFAPDNSRLTLHFIHAVSLVLFFTSPSAGCGFRGYCRIMSFFFVLCWSCVIPCQEQHEWRMYVSAWGMRCLFFDSPWDMGGSAPLAPKTVDWLKVERCVSWQRPCLAACQLYAHDSCPVFSCICWLTHRPPAQFSALSISLPTWRHIELEIKVKDCKPVVHLPSLIRFKAKRVVVFFCRCISLGCQIILG